MKLNPYSESSVRLIMDVVAGPTGSHPPDVLRTIEYRIRWAIDAAVWEERRALERAFRARMDAWEKPEWNLAIESCIDAIGARPEAHEVKP